MAGADEDTGADGTGGRGRARRLAESARFLVGGAAGAALLVLLNVPAGALFGAVLGSAMVNARWPGRQVTRSVRVVGLVLLGCVVGARVDAESLSALLGVLLPAAIGVLVLLLVDVGLALLLSRGFGLDVRTALFACAPGGFGEMVAAAQEVGAKVGVVVAIHLVRVLIVVLGVLPLLILVLGVPS
ncbi:MULTISPECIES: AbrB family transcriptional regulator [Actinoalloteichus]|uniref:Membrane protein AbrB duplication n=1 Tax=Actinoalloteichus caeruleus DSM 43889 TaxID=1120930 RepID=A0ABT1JGR3_ACTCY|nr:MULTISPECIES: AbrB family transcriptional regulator [Actinoalloteichus]MCP2331623.1 hypothetical protein [Actinoalloteichus caeruleus DSM 43889]